MIDVDQPVNLDDPRVRSMLAALQASESATRPRRRPFIRRRRVEPPGPAVTPTVISSGAQRDLQARQKRRWYARASFDTLDVSAIALVLGFGCWLAICAGICTWQTTISLKALEMGVVNLLPAALILRVSLNFSQVRRDEDGQRQDRADDRADDD